HVRRHVLYEGDLLLNRFGVAEQEALGAVGAGPDAIHVPVPGFDPDQVVAQAVNLLVDLTRGLLFDGDATDERFYSDTDVEHREGTPQWVAGQCPEGGPNYLNEGHAKVSCVPCRTRRASSGAAWRRSPRRARPRHRLHHGHPARPSTPVLERDDHEAQGCRPS